MLTGIVLFRSRTGQNYDKTECHLAQIINVFGEVPAEMRMTTSLGSEYFDRKGTLKANDLLKLGKLRHLPDINPKGSSIKRLIELVQSKSVMRIDLSVEEILAIDDLLNRMLAISPERRASASELLQHRWFSQR